MNTTKICPICNREFATNQNAKKFCTEWCRKKARKSDIGPQYKQCTCAWCGITFSSPRRKLYCSNECRLFANGRYSLTKPQPVHKKPTMSLEQTVALARLAGMTYGEYVQKHNI